MIWHDSMHVMHVTKRYPTSVGGDATAVAALERALRNNGHRVTIVTSRTPSITRRKNVHRLGVPGSDETLDRVGLTRILSCLWTMLWGLRLLLRERPDVVHAHAPELGAAVALPARLLRIPRVLTLHGTTIGRPECGSKAQLERLLVRTGDYQRLFTVDPQSLPGLAGLARAPALFIPNGVTLDDYPVWRGGQNARLLFVGRLEAVKGLDILLRAIAAARAQGCDAALDIVGAGRLESDLRALASHLQVSEHITFAGECPHEQVLARMADAAGLVLASRYEGFPFVLLEALAVGLPVITTSVGAIPEICTDGQDALIVPPGDVLALARAIMTLLSNQALAHRLGVAGTRTVAQYSNETVSARIEQQYRAVVADRSRRHVASDR